MTTRTKGHFNKIKLLVKDESYFTSSTTKSENGKGAHGQRDIPTTVNGQNQQAGMAGLEPTTLVMGTSNSKP